MSYRLRVGDILALRPGRGRPGRAGRADRAAHGVLVQRLHDHLAALRGLHPRVVQARRSRDPGVRESLRNSIIVASIVAPACVVLGTATAWGITRFRFRGRGFWAGLVGAPLVVPWLVIGVSGLVFFAYLEIELSLVTVTAMHIAVTFPLVTALVSPRGWCASSGRRRRRRSTSAPRSCS